MHPRAAVAMRWRELKQFAISSWISWTMQVTRWGVHTGEDRKGGDDGGDSNNIKVRNARPMEQRRLNACFL